MGLNDALSGAVLIVAVVIVVLGVVRALMDGQRLWAIGMAVATALYAPLGVVLAIVYTARVRKALPAG